MKDKKDAESKWETKSQKADLTQIHSANGT